MCVNKTAFLGIEKVYSSWVLVYEKQTNIKQVAAASLNSTYQKYVAFIKKLTYIKVCKDKRKKRRRSMVMRWNKGLWIYIYMKA